MARMNPRRRRLAAQEALLRSITNEHGKAHDDSHLLQRGPVRSSYERIGKQSPVNLKAMTYRANTRPDGYAPAFYRDGASLKYQGDK